MTEIIRNFIPEETELLTGINLIEASAGTGKTYTLATLVLRFIIDKEIDIKNILVVTFTKAATEELKDRIRSRLVDARLAVGDLEDKLGQWMASLGVDEKIILKRINFALLEIDQASIFTLHGFCQRTLSEHALESGQLFDTELMTDTRAVYQACSDDFWRKTIYLRSQWEASVLIGCYKTPDDLLKSIGSIPPYMPVYPNYKNIDEALDELDTLRQTYKEDIATLLLSIEESLGDKKFTPNFIKGFEGMRKTIEEWLDKKSNQLPDFSIFTEEGLIAKLNGHKFRVSKANLDTPKDQKISYLDSLSFDGSPFEALHKAINHITLTLRRSLLETLNEDLEKILQRDNVLSFNDLIIRLADALYDDTGNMLRQEIQKQYQVALIDEFQDTDPKQWLIFSEIFCTEKHFLYLIGDPKQAIYKFRGADIHSYFLAKEKANHEFSLARNWRSHPELINGINTLFSRQAPFLFEALNFHPVKAALEAKEGELVKKNKPLSPVVLWQLDNMNKGFWKSTAAEKQIVTEVVNEVLNLLKNEFFIQKNEEQDKVEPEDIAILVKTNTQAKAFQHALNKAGVIAVINNHESVFASPEANDLYLLLQSINQPNNNALIKQALSLSWFNLDGQALRAEFNDEKAMNGWLFRFHEYQQLWRNKGLMPMVRKFLTEEKIFHYLSLQPQTERRITNIQHCIELIQRASVEDHLGPNKTLHFLKRSIHQSENSLEEQKLRLESDENAAKIITMHSSKGLEYPIVFCPFLWQRNLNTKKEKTLVKCYTGEGIIADLGSDQFEEHLGISLKEELAEDLRIFYVAVTRAKYRCYINWADVRTKDTPNASAMAYLFDFDLDDFFQQQNKLKKYAQDQPSAFEYRLQAVDKKVTEIWVPQLKKKALSYREKQRLAYSHWQMSSYTALSELSITDAPELPEDKAREYIVVSLVEPDHTMLPKGAHMGNVIHDLLENISFKQLATESDISVRRDQSCLRYGVKTDFPEKIDHLLQQTVCTTIKTNDVSFSLKDLEWQQCLKEMPFYLSMKVMDASHINMILKDNPTFQPLSNKILSGYLTGYIDLICEYEGRYYVMDYKSNYLESYTHEALESSMREHNYGLQYWIYTLVLHLYLQNKLPGYQYEKHIGGVVYLFVRGMDENKENSGVYYYQPEQEKIEQLAQLFVDKAKSNAR